MKTNVFIPEDNIKTSLKEDVDCITLAEDGVYWQTGVNFLSLSY
jgi:hypothetical protein